MKLNDVQKKKLKSLARSTKGSFLIEYLELVKAEVADIRSKLDVKPEIEREVRLGICDVIDELLIQVLQRNADELEPADDHWN